MIKQILLVVVLLGIGWVLFNQGTITGMSVWDHSDVILDNPSIIIDTEDLQTCCLVDGDVQPPRFCRVQKTYDCSLCDAYCA